MSRLIDADKLIEDVLNSMPTGSARGVFRAFIDDQPTAFDVDKVVTVLECAEGTVCGHKDIPNDCGGCAGCTECKMEDAYRIAIEIVKAGGIDD